MYFSLNKPRSCHFNDGYIFICSLLGFPIAFTLMAMGIGFGYYAYYDAVLMDHII